MFGKLLVSGLQIASGHECLVKVPGTDGREGIGSVSVVGPIAGNTLQKTFGCFNHSRVTSVAAELHAKYRLYNEEEVYRAV